MKIRPKPKNYDKDANEESFFAENNEDGNLSTDETLADGNTDGKSGS
jgi:hypothetical protein